ncbi:ecdysteroid 22-kinase family protein [Pseudoalteromonas denitrificans]|uniref:Ecdysteroid kinase n=1 Tax=Pseudoalteromonas denitrificans DSM 6059 TaxID=1123010 RepID=A0A1I1LGT2_9GAMM|nr:ecdysteroid 22-kinase family protein [Pseudoalteromonas denitrificans]SFC72156.1 Ecdysteroid kinase [Pseudoalteromonas denitrificans DSM 6059]
MLLSELAISTLKAAFGNGIQITNVTLIQALWSDFGQLLRVELVKAPVKSVIIKRISVPNDKHHPKGWHSVHASQRKVRSYQVESHWYQKMSKSCQARVAKCFLVSSKYDETVIVLEDLALCEFTPKTQVFSLQQVKQCLDWLAKFHAQYLNIQSNRLWHIGSYWHLATRSGELAAMADQQLQFYAKDIDNKLNRCQYQTLVHGDAKLANFLFNKQKKQAAAVDFQYIGGGVGIKDVMLLLSSMPQKLMAHEQALLNFYFMQLSQYLDHFHPNVKTQDVCHQWRELYPYAWADFVRFLKGWSPEHAKLNTHSLSLTEQVLHNLKSGHDTSSPTSN